MGSGSWIKKSATWNSGGGKEGMMKRSLLTGLLLLVFLFDMQDFAPLVIAA